MASLDDEDWDGLAHRWRQAAGIDENVRVNAPKFIKWMKRAGHIKNYVLLPDQELPVGRGHYDPDQGIIFFRQSVWDAAEKGEPTAIWTLIHECCHPIMQHREVRYRADTSNKRTSRSTNKDEFEGHRLTAILAPFNKIAFQPGMTAAADVMNHFGLSQEAATRRIQEFERMYRRKHGLPRPLPPGVVDFLTAQKRKGFIVKSLPSVEALAPRPAPKYEGDSCPGCQEFKLVRKGVSLRCDNCGAQPGDD